MSYLKTVMIKKTRLFLEITLDALEVVVGVHVGIELEPRGSCNQSKNSQNS